MSKTTIKGIDISECGFCCWKHNGNELIENYCAVFNNKCICNPQCYFKKLKRLQEENKELKERLCETKQLLKDDYKKSSKFCQKIEAYQLSANEAKEIIAELKHENEVLRDTCNAWGHTSTQHIEKIERYKQALEEIKKEANRLLYEENPIYGYNNSNYFEVLAKYVLAKTDEVLNDRD